MMRDYDWSASNNLQSSSDSLNSKEELSPSEHFDEVSMEKSLLPPPEQLFQPSPQQFICSSTRQPLPQEPLASPHAVMNPFLPEPLSASQEPIPAIPQEPHNTKIVSGSSSNRLPHPCPVPELFSPRVMKALSNNSLQGNAKLALIREAGLFYYGLCPQSTPAEYDTMAKTLCDRFQLSKTKLL